MFGTLKLCGIILLWDEECFRWMRCSSSSGKLVSPGEMQWIIQALVGLLCPCTGTCLCPNTTGLPSGTVVLGSFICWHHMRKLGGIIPELLAKGCAPHPSMEQFQDCITSPLHGVQAPSVLLSTWVLLIRRNMLGKSGFY